MVVLREVLGTLLAVVAEVAGAGILLAHEQAAGIGQSGESLTDDGGHDGAFLERCSPCWGHHGEALCYRCGDSQGENPDVRQRRLGVVTFLKVSCMEPRHLWWWSWPVVLLEACWFVLLSGC
jgi:hypothetical protein